MISEEVPMDIMYSRYYFEPTGELFFATKKDENDSYSIFIRHFRFVDTILTVYNGNFVACR